MKKNKQKPHLHRELMPARQCKTRGCGTWLASANEDDYCAACGGWTTQRLVGMPSIEATADLYAELMAA
jgi:hypothetical protein